MMPNQLLPPVLRGWPLLPLPDSNGRLDYPVLEESVRQSIRVLLSTRPGEQLMRPSFGAGLQGFLHEQNTLTTRRRIRDLVTDSLARWETRITVDRVDVRELPDEPTKIRVEIAYRLKRTGAPQQLGLTMELEA
jgi:hypothetical protein